MVIVDLGVPPGFTLLTGDFDRLRRDGLIARYEMAGRQVILYLRSMEAGQELLLPYRLKARFPIRAKTPSSTVYQYYNPEVRSEAAPQVIMVR